MIAIICLKLLMPQYWQLQDKKIDKFFKNWAKNKTN